MTFVLVNNTPRGDDLGVAETVESFIPDREEYCVSDRLVNPYAKRLPYMIAITYYGGVANPDTATNMNMRPMFNSTIAYAFRPSASPAAEVYMGEIKSYSKMTRAAHYKNESAVRIRQCLKR